jgi:hypothetical protein
MRRASLSEVEFHKKREEPIKTLPFILLVELRGIEPLTS